MNNKQLLWLLTDWSGIQVSDDGATFSLKSEFVTPVSVDVFLLALREVCECEINSNTEYVDQLIIPEANGMVIYRVLVKGFSKDDADTLQNWCHDEWY